MKVFFVSKIQENWKSGLAVSLVSIPLAVSLAVASHASPVSGIITAIWAGLIAALFGGSNFNVIGPTGALSGLLMTYALTYGTGALSMLALLSGLFILIAYFFKLERYLVYFPACTIHGFTLGVAIIIILNQLNYVFGLSGLPQHTHFLSNVLETFRHISGVSWLAVGIFLCFLILLFVLTRVMPNIPGAIILAPCAIILGYLSSHNFVPLALQTLESRYPNLQTSLFSLPVFHFSHSLVIPAITIAIIAILETMISARIADGLTKTKHNKRKEMLGLSLANMASGLTGGIPATAALARTALNVKTGATHKTSAVISSVCIMLISLVFLPFFKYIPLTAIAAMLVFVSVKMVEHEHFARMFRIEKKNYFLSLGVAAVTVYEDPIVGILLGATIAMLIFMEKLSKGSFELKTREEFVYSHKQDIKDQGYENLQRISTLIYTIKGELAYINAQSHITRFEEYPVGQKAVILDLKELYFIDHDGIEAFGELVELLHMQNKIVLVVGVTPFVAQMLAESVEFKNLKEKNLVFNAISQALAYLS